MKPYAGSDSYQPWDRAEFISWRVSIIFAPAMMIGFFGSGVFLLAYISSIPAYFASREQAQREVHVGEYAARQKEDEDEDAAQGNKPGSLRHSHKQASKRALAMLGKAPSYRRNPTQKLVTGASKVEPVAADTKNNPNGGAAAQPASELKQGHNNPEGGEKDSAVVTEDFLAEADVGVVFAAGDEDEGDV